MASNTNSTQENGKQNKQHSNDIENESDIEASPEILVTATNQVIDYIQTLYDLVRDREVFILNGIERSYKYKTMVNLEAGYNGTVQAIVLDYFPKICNFLAGNEIMVIFVDPDDTDTELFGKGINYGHVSINEIRNQWAQYFQ
eukprot:398841_1